MHAIVMTDDNIINTVSFEGHFRNNGRLRLIHGCLRNYNNMAESDSGATADAATGSCVICLEPFDGMPPDTLVRVLAKCAGWEYLKHPPRSHQVSTLNV